MEDSDIDDVATRLGENLIARILENDSVGIILGLLDSGSPVWYQSEIEGISPLHAAAYVQNAELVKLLIEKGAVWNAVDYLKNTAGDIALSFNNAEIYTLIRDAGIRSELLLGLLGTRSLSDSSTLLLRATDDTAFGSSGAFLKSKLRYKVEHGQNICVLDVDGEEIGVMMGWEEDIMRETVQRLYLDHPKASGLKILNIGFGLGIIDSLFQSLPSHPIQHVIIEAHPDVLRHMRETGWYDKSGVKILEGRWQDFLDGDLLSGFDVIYTDTFSEDYSDLRQFFERIPNLMADVDSRFSFFNGLGATNPFFYDIYTHISELHLASLGLHVDWSDVDVSHDIEKDRWGQSPDLEVAFYIYDRHCICVYYQDWHRTKRPKPAAEGGLLPGVSQVVSPVPSTITEANSGLSSGFNSPRNTLSSTTGIVVTMSENSNELPSTPPLQSSVNSAASSTGLPFDEEAKLVYGVVISLRNMIKKLSGRDEQFVNYRTSAYKLHLFETLSGYKFVMLSDPKTDSLRFVLRQIYIGPFLEYVVRNPLLKMDSRQQGIDNEYFRSSVDRLIRALSVFT